MSSFQIKEYPLGNPASLIFSIVFPLSKQIEACFTTTVFPARSAEQRNEAPARKDNSMALHLV